MKKNKKNKSEEIARIVDTSPMFKRMKRGIIEDIKNRTFELAPQDKTEELSPYMDKILKALGFPDSLATDESLIWDFMDVFDREAGYRALAKAEKKLGIKIDKDEYVIDVANRLQGRDWGVKAAKKLRKVK